MTRQVCAPARDGSAATVTASPVLRIEPPAASRPFGRVPTGAPGIARSVTLLPSELCPHAEVHVWLEGTWLAEHCGRGATEAEAYADALRRYPREAA